MKHEITTEELLLVLNVKNIQTQSCSLGKTSKEAIIKFVARYISDMVNFFLKENNIPKLLSIVDVILSDPSYSFTKEVWLREYSIEPFKTFPGSRCIIEDEESYGKEICPQRLQNMVLNKNLGFLITAQLLKVVANDLKIANSMDLRVKKITAENIQYFAKELLTRLKDNIDLLIDDSHKETLKPRVNKRSCLIM